MSRGPDAGHPHGWCECGPADHPGEGCPGPVAWEITRDGKQLKLCTRCTLSGDSHRKVLVTGEEKVDLYARYDSLGAAILMLDMLEAQKAAPVLH